MKLSRFCGKRESGNVGWFPNRKIHDGVNNYNKYFRNAVKHQRILIFNNLKDPRMPQFLPETHYVHGSYTKYAADTLDLPNLH